jgi:hypothetical protein
MCKIFDSDNFGFFVSDKKFVVVFTHEKHEKNVWQAEAKPLAYLLISVNKRKHTDNFVYFVKILILAQEKIYDCQRKHSDIFVGKILIPSGQKNLCLRN